MRVQVCLCGQIMQASLAQSDRRGSFGVVNLMSNGYAIDALLHGNKECTDNLVQVCYNFSYQQRTCIQSVFPKGLQNCSVVNVNICYFSISLSLKGKTIFFYCIFSVICICLFYFVTGSNIICERGTPYHDNQLPCIVKFYATSMIFLCSLEYGEALNFCNIFDESLLSIYKMLIRDMSLFLQTSSCLQLS